MSMNLWCNKVELPQIPTYPSYMIYSNKDGGTKGILYRLEQYFRGKCQTEFNSAKNPLEQKIARETLEARLALIKGLREEKQVRWEII